MGKIKIGIEEARIKNYEVRFNDEGLPRVSVTLSLMANNKEISTFSLSSNNWNGESFELDLKLLKQINAVSDELERIATIHCSSSIGYLTN